MDASAPHLTWLKSSHSDSSNGSECVEVATTPHTIHVRDSTHPNGPRLSLAPSVWAGFLSYATGR